MEIVINCKQLLGHIIIVLGVITISLIVFYTFIQNWYNKHFKQNCFNCEYYKIDDISEDGAICWCKCEKYDILDTHKFGEDKQYVECRSFKNKENTKKEKEKDNE